MLHALIVRALAVLAACVTLVYSPIAHADADAHAGPGPGRVGYMMSLDGLTSDLAILSAMAMPGESVRITVAANASASGGVLSQEGDDWVWTAPERPGLQQLRFSRDGEMRTLNIFVLTPWDNGSAAELDGYRIGAYAATPFRGMASYLPPEGFIRADDALLDVKVAPNFTLRQFLCKQQPGHDTAFLLISTATLMKLEDLLVAVRAAGHDVDTLHVMSGFRTPWYNASIGNSTTSSRHLFGGASDVFIDSDGDGWMDDLNGDGKVDIEDAKVLAGLAERLSERSERSRWPLGGIGIYSANSVRGPFVHIDSRGYEARW